MQTQYRFYCIAIDAVHTALILLYIINLSTAGGGLYLTLNIRPFIHITRVRNWPFPLPVVDLCEPYFSNKGQIAVSLGKINAIADHKFIRYFKTDQVGIYIDLAP